MSADKITKELAIKDGPIDIIKHRWVYLIISFFLLAPGVYFIVNNMMNLPQNAPVRLGIDFTGGTILKLGFENKLEQEDLGAVREIFEKYGYTGSVIQLQTPREQLAQTQEADAKPSSDVSGPSAISVESEKSDNTNILATETTTADAKVETMAETAVDEPVSMETSDIQSILSVRAKQLKGDDGTLIQQELAKTFGGRLELLQKTSIGPTIASELMTNGLLALLFAYLLIVGYLTFRFEFDYAVCAMVALVHDTLFVFGVFAMLGMFFQTEVDSLFVTAILTVIGFSVHDTIVVFDRLRENSRIYFSKKLPFSTIANASVNQTLARSINTSVTALFTLFALFFFGGETTRDFVLAAILGISVGTYSSICVASLALAWWRERQVTKHAAA
ncbi:MAG: protein translocase subunit SecF [Vampirovibrio sp.]|nr:protein translocase subunit SecF [Vampirovibrio sp.]